MTTDRKPAGKLSPGTVPFVDLALLAIFDVLRGAVAAPAAAGVLAWLVGASAELAGALAGLEARARDGGLRAGVVMHSGYHPHVPVVANLTGRFLGTGTCPV